MKTCGTTFRFTSERRALARPQAQLLSSRCSRVHKAQISESPRNTTMSAPNNVSSTNSSADWDAFEVFHSPNIVPATVLFGILFLGFPVGLKCWWSLTYYRRIKESQKLFGRGRAFQQSSTGQDGVIGDRTDADDEAALVAQAATRLNDGQAEAKRASRFIMGIASRTMVASNILLGLGPVFFVLDLYIGLVTVPALLAITVAGIACGDPSRPRFVRELAPWVVFTAWVLQPAFCFFWAVVDVGSTLPQATTFMSITWSMCFAAMGLAWMIMCIYALPAMFPARNERLARLGNIAEWGTLGFGTVLNEQRAMLKAAGYKDRNMCWQVWVMLVLDFCPHMYLLEGAGFFAVSVRDLIRRALACVRVVWLTTGVRDPEIKRRGHRNHDRASTAHMPCSILGGAGGSHGNVRYRSQLALSSVNMGWTVPNWPCFLPPELHCHPGWTP